MKRPILRAGLAVFTLCTLCAAGCGDASNDASTIATEAGGGGDGDGAPSGSGGDSGDSDASSDGAATSNVVALAVHRFDGQSGAIAISNGIPLVPGRLMTAASVANVRLFVGDTETQMHVEPLEGKYADGSLESLLVQFDATLDATQTLTASLVFGSPRTTTDLAKRGTSPRPQAAALPSDPEYLSATRIAGPLISLAKAKSAGLPAQVTSLLTDFPTLAATLWSAHGASLYDRFVNISGGNQNNIAVYEDVLTTYQYWLMTADPKYWQEGNALAYDLKENFIVNGYTTFTNSGCPNNDYTYCPSSGAEGEWVNSTEGLGVHYRVTGDDDTRQKVGNQAQFLFGATVGFNEMQVPDGNERLKGRTIVSGIDALLLNGPESQTWGQLTPAGTTAKSNAPLSSVAWQDAWKGSVSLDSALTFSLQIENADGSFPSTSYGNGQKNYMVAMLLWSWIRDFEENGGDARIPPAVKRALDWMWTNQWDAGSQSFPYCSATGGDCTTGASPGLNGLILVPFQWYAAYSKDASYQAKCDQIASGLAADKVTQNGWTYYPKLFDEAYYRFFNTLAWRSGIR